MLCFISGWLHTFTARIKWPIVCGCVLRIRKAISARVGEFQLLHKRKRSHRVDRQLFYGGLNCREFGPRRRCHVQVHSNIQGLQSAGGVRRQAPLLPAHRARGHPALCPQPRGAPARRQSHSRFAQGEYIVGSAQGLSPSRSN